MPEVPEAWLLTAARNNLLQAMRARKVADDPAVTILLGEEETPARETALIPDERLRLMFVCAHPSIDPGIRCALMLQSVLGLDARQIAAAFLVAPATMAQRLVRAKAKIRTERIPFDEPEARELPSRTAAVLEAIYAAFSLSTDRVHMDDGRADDLISEALYLSELAAALLPHDAEALGLHALLTFCSARRGARRGLGDAFVPLHEQDVGAWDMAAIRYANDLLWRAASMRDRGPFQIEAAIQSAHCERAFSGRVPWDAIAQLYAELATFVANPGVTVGRAIALGEAGDIAAGLALLDAIDRKAVGSYQPYWVARAHLSARAGHRDAAATEYATAIGLTELPEVRDYLAAQRARLSG